MKIKINEEKKRVYVWLRRSENTEEKTQTLLRGIIKNYKSQNILVVIFRSGQNDLAEQTAKLLEENL